MLNSKRSEKRKYQGTWEQLKVVKQLVLTITNPDALTKEQKHQQLKTIRKAIQKEKYYDSTYKRHYPQALITSTMDIEAGTIVFVLRPEPLPVEELF